MLIDLPVQRFVLAFHASLHREPPSFAGNAWRGAFGHALRAAACLTGSPSCTGCSRKPDCAYAYVFETPPPADARLMRLYPSVPHPFVLRELPPRQPGRVELLLTLVGRAASLVPLLVNALAQAAGGPCGIAGQRLVLQEVLQESALGECRWQRIDRERGVLAPFAASASDCPAAPEHGVRLNWLTPLRVKKEGRAVAADALSFGDVFGALMRRVSMLCAFHAAAPLRAPFAELAESSRHVRMRARLAPVRQQRFSNRQRQAVPMDGLTGWIELDADDAQAFWPFLWIGQFVHAGSAATMGLGCYRIELVSDGPAKPAASLPSLPQTA